VKPKAFAAVDLDKLTAEIAATIEKAKADDPRELRKQISELQKTVQKHTSNVPKTQIERVPAPVLTEADRALLKAVADRMAGMATELGSAAGGFLAGVEDRAEQIVLSVMQRFAKEAIGAHDVRRREFERILDSKGFQKILSKLATYTPTTHSEAGSRTTPAASQGRRVAPAAATSRPASLPPSPGARPAGGKLGQRILNALASVDHPLRRDQLGVRCVARADAGHFGNTLGDLKAAGLIESVGGEFVLTAAGRAAAGPPVEDLVAAWKGKLSGLEADIFQHLVDAHPNALTRDRLGELTGKRSDAGHFGNCLGTLRGNGIAENTGRGSELRASAELFS
jgi:hypothetical protein